MAVFVDPRTGERYENVPDDEQDRASSEFGLVPLEQYEEQQAYDAQPLTAKAADVATAGLQGVARGAMAPGIALQKAITGTTPDMSAPDPDSMLSESVFSPEARKRAERHPFVAGAGEAVPSMLAGGALGAGAVGLRAGAAALGAESLLSGASQEAVAATVEDRDFSAQAALANGATEFLFGAVAGAVVGGLARPRKLSKNLLAEAEETAGSAAPKGTKGSKQRFMSERPEPQSAGAAAADFDDTVWEKAIKSIDDDKLDKEAIFLAQHEKPILQMTTIQVADNLDEVKRLMDEGISEAVRAEDFTRGATTWTPQMIKRQAAWMAEHVDQESIKAIESIKASKKAVETGEGWDAKGLGADAITALKNHRARILAAEGADRNIALNQGKQALDKMIKRVGANRTLDDGAKQNLIGVLRNRADAWREGLQDAEKWGVNADLQTALNAAWHRTAEPLGRIQNRLMEILGHKYGEVGATALDKRTRATAVDSILKQPPAIRREFDRDLANALDGVEELSNARSEHGLSRLEGMEPLRAALRDLREDFNLASTLQVAKRRAEDVTRSNPSLASAVASELAGMASTGLPGVGSAARGVWRTMRNAPSAPKQGSPLARALDRRMQAYARMPELGDPSFSRQLPDWMKSTLKGHGGQVAGVAALLGAGAALVPGEAGATELDQFEQKDPRVAQALNNVARSTGARVETAVADLFSTTAPKPTPEYRALVRRSEKSGHSLAMTRFMGRKHDDPEEAFEQKRATIAAIVADPSQLVERMAQSWGDLPEQQPEVFSKMAMQMSSLVTYLHAYMPQPTGKSLMNKDGYPPTYEEIEEWAGRWQGTFDPLSTVDDIASGNAPDEAMEAVRDNWGSLFKRFQSAALGQLQVFSEKGEDVPREQLEYLDRVLDLNGAADPMLAWDMALLIEQAEQHVAQHPATEGMEDEQQTQQQAPPQPIDTKAPERMTPVGFQMMKNQ